MTIIPNNKVKNDQWPQKVEKIQIKKDHTVNIKNDHDPHGPWGQEMTMRPNIKKIKRKENRKIFHRKGNCLSLSSSVRPTKKEKIKKDKADIKIIDK